MTRVVVFCQRRSDLSGAEFRAYWRTTHAELVSRQPGLFRYVQNHVVEDGPVHGAPVIDGVAEAWFESREAMRLSVATEAADAVLADEANFVAPGSIRTLLLDEPEAMEDGIEPVDGLKLIQLYRRRAVLDGPDFREKMERTVRPLLAAVPNVRRHRQSYASDSMYRRGRSPEFDAVFVSWFENIDAVFNALASTAAERALDAVNELTVAGVELVAEPVEVVLEGDRPERGQEG